MIAAFITIGGGLFVSDMHVYISFMASIIEVWSWITIHVYSDINVKKYIEDLKLDMTGKWALPLGLLIEFIGRVAQLGLYIYFVDHPLVDEGGPIILLV